MTNCTSNLQTMRHFDIVTGSCCCICWRAASFSKCTLRGCPATEIFRHGSGYLFLLTRFLNPAQSFEVHRQYNAFGGRGCVLVHSMVAFLTVAGQRTRRISYALSFTPSLMTVNHIPVERKSLHHHTAVSFHQCEHLCILNSRLKTVLSFLLWH